MTAIPVQAIVGAQAGGVGGANSVSVALGSNATAGNTLVAVSAYSGSGTPVFTNFTDNKGNVYTTDDNINLGTGSRAVVGHVLNIAAGATTITANWTGTSGTPGAMAILVGEFLVADCNSLDKHVARTTTGTNPSSGATATTTHQHNTNIAWAQVVGANTTTVGAGFQDFASQASTTAFTIFMEDQYVTTTGAQTGSFVDAASLLYACGILSFKSTIADTSGQESTLASTGAGS